MSELHGLAFDRAQWSSEEQWVCDQIHVPLDSIRESAMLVARGVRPMSLVQSWSGLNEGSVERVFGALRCIAAEWHVLPFAVGSPAGSMHYGFAAEPWVIDLLRYTITSKDAEPHKHDIIGLLLGYSPRAIQEHAQLCSAKVQR